jgi:protein-S-isoprenylcysteine O-methyltransferase Ste14
VPIDLTFFFSMAFLASEVILSRVRRSKTMSFDAGSLRGLHWTIGFSIAAGATIAFFGYGHLDLAEVWRVSLCIGLLSVGALIRWVAIHQLGKRFTVGVEVQSDHALIRDGLYKHVRHPSYFGLMLEFIGLSFYFSNWITQPVILLPVTIALVYRIRIEEQVLLDEFGTGYEDYSRQTARLIPWVW